MVRNRFSRPEVDCASWPGFCVAQTDQKVCISEVGGLFQHIWAWDTKQGMLPSQDLSKEKAKGIWGQKNGPGSGETVTSERRPEAKLPEGWGGTHRRAAWPLALGTARGSSAH